MPETNVLKMPYLQCQVPENGDGILHRVHNRRKDGIRLVTVITHAGQNVAGWGGVETPMLRRHPGWKGRFTNNAISNNQQ